eukprot:PhM_4_TR8193/c1_g1_i1/m.69069
MATAKQSKELQAGITEQIDKYKKVARDLGRLSRGTVVDLSQPRTTYRCHTDHRMYGDPELYIVFKESNKLRANQLLNFTQRMWVYATNAHIRTMNAKSARSVFKAHSGSVTDVHVVDYDHPSNILIVTADAERKLCVWSVNDKAETPTGTQHILHEFGGTEHVVKIASFVTPTDIKLYTLSTTNQVSVYSLPLDIWSVKDQTSLGPCTILMEPSNTVRDLAVTKDMVVVSTGDRLVGFSPVKHNTIFEIQTTSKSGNISFVQPLSKSTIVLSTATSLQLWSLEPEPFLSQVIEIDMADYRLQAHLPKTTTNWCLVAAPMVANKPLVCVHLAQSGQRFSMDFISEYELIGQVHSFQVFSGEATNSIAVYMMHGNAVVQMVLGTRAIMNMPAPKKDKKDDKKTTPTSSKTPQTGSASSAMPSAPVVRPQLRTDEDKIKYLESTVVVQREQIQALTELVEMQTEAVRALTANIANNQQKSSASSSSSSEETERLKALANEFARSIENIPKIVTSSLVKICHKDGGATRLSNSDMNTIQSAVQNHSKDAIANVVQDTYQKILSEFGAQARVLQGDLTEWRAKVQMSIQRAQTTVGTMSAGSGATTAGASDAGFSPEAIKSLISSRKYGDAIKMTVRTKKPEDIMLLLNELDSIDKDNVLSSGEIPLDAAVALLVALSQDLKDAKTIDQRLEWIQAIGMCDSFMSRKGETKAAYQVCGEKLSEARAKEDFPAATKRNIKLALNLFA